MENILQLLTDPENQPHQYVGDTEGLKALIEAAKEQPVGITDNELRLIERYRELYQKGDVIMMNEMDYCNELLKRESSGVDFSTIKVLGLSVQDIARQKAWFESAAGGKSVAVFWQEAFDAGVKAYAKANNESYGTPYD